MTPADKQLRQFMLEHEQVFMSMPPEVAERFYQLVRAQTLTDVADYLTRMGTTIHNKMRGANPGLAKKIRQIFYGCAHQVRNNGSSGREQVDEMLEAMKGPPMPVFDIQGMVKQAHEEQVQRRFSRIGDEEDGDPA
jgi:hypothetical protein